MNNVTDSFSSLRFSDKEKKIAPLELVDEETTPATRFKSLDEKKMTTTPDSSSSGIIDELLSSSNEKMRTPDSSSSGSSGVIDGDEPMPDLINKEKKMKTPDSSSSGSTGSSGVIDGAEDVLMLDLINKEKKKTSLVESDDNSVGKVTMDHWKTYEYDRTPFPKLFRFSDLSPEEEHGIDPLDNPMFQLFSVRVKYDIDKPGKLNGFILAADKYGLLEDGWIQQEPNWVCLFNVGEDDPIPIVNDSFLTLNDPSCDNSIPAFETVVIFANFDVAIDDHKEYLAVCNYQMSWDFSCYPHTSLFDRSKSFIAEGDNGSIQLYYMALQNAVETNIELSFTTSDHRGKLVTGKIVASYGDGFYYDCGPDEYDYFKAILFEADNSSPLFLETGEIPQIKYMVIAPATYSLVIEARLKDPDSGKVIFNGSCKLPVRLKGSSRGHIKGTGCGIDVKVEWKCKPVKKC